MAEADPMRIPQPAGQEPRRDERPAAHLTGFDRFVRHYGGEFRHTVNAFVARYSLISNDPVLDCETFPWCDELAARVDDLRADVEAHMPREAPAIADLAPDHEGINPDHGWKSVFLMGYGHTVPEMCARFPVVWDAVKDIPDLFSVLISVHTPGTHLVRHEGVTKGILTYHLPLRVPREGAKCRIEVIDHMHCWREGEPFLFDDTYEHEVWNDSGEPRINLMIHVKRPLRGAGKVVQEAGFWIVDRVAFVRDAKANVRAWVEGLTEDKPAERAD